MSTSGAALLENLMPELEKAFRDPPHYGALGFRVHFIDGQVSRVEWEHSQTRRIAPQSKE